MVYGIAGSIIMDASSLFFLIGIMIYTSLYRKRGRLDDKLFTAMILVNMAYSVVELMSYSQEGLTISFMRGLMIVENTVVYAAMVLFPYLFMLYTEFRISRDHQRTRRVMLAYSIPCVVYFVILGINLKTGWIFSINEGCQFIDGPVDQIVFVPILFYYAVSLFRVRRINPRLVFLGLTLFAVRMVWDLWFRPIQSTSFIYTLFLAFAHIHVMNQPLMEEKP